MFESRFTLISRIWSNCCSTYSLYSSVEISFFRRNWHKYSISRLSVICRFGGNSPSVKRELFFVIDLRECDILVLCDIFSIWIHNLRSHTSKSNRKLHQTNVLLNNLCIDLCCRISDSVFCIVLILRRLLAKK